MAGAFHRFIQILVYFFPGLCYNRKSSGETTAVFPCPRLLAGILTFVRYVRKYDSYKAAASAANLFGETGPESGRQIGTDISKAGYSKVDTL